MDDRKRFFDALAAKYPPGSILRDDAQKVQGRHKDLAKSMSAAEARLNQTFDAGKAERPGDLPKRRSVAITRRERVEPFGGSRKRLSVLHALPSTFGMETLDETIADVAVSATEVERSLNQPLPSQRSSSMMEASRQPTYEPDYNIMSESVMSLDESNFDDFIEGKEKALVLFYKNFQCPMTDFEANFADVAESSRKPKHGFGAVDCVMNRALCSREKICCVPELKLYSNGFEVGGMIKAQNATTGQMSLMVAMTPVLKQPKIITNPSFQTSHTHKRASAMW